MARPTKYNAELLAKADEYIKHCKDNKRIPTIRTLVKQLGIGRRTFYDLKTKHESIANIHARIIYDQVHFLVVKKGIGSDSILKFWRRLYFSCRDSV
jgi:hypothetical protein